MSSTRATGIALAFVTALISGVAIFVNGHTSDSGDWHAMVMRVR